MRRATHLLVGLSVLGTAACVPNSVTGSRPAPPAPETAAQSAPDAGAAAEAAPKKPLDQATILLRGPKSLHPPRANEPLYVIDGVVITGTDGLNRLRARDIESIEVLRGARAAAIYGSRAANGAILITTRRPDR